MGCGVRSPRLYLHRAGARLRRAFQGLGFPGKGLIFPLGKAVSDERCTLPLALLKKIAKFLQTNNTKETLVVQ